MVSETAIMNLGRDTEGTVRFAAAWAALTTFVACSPTSADGPGVSTSGRSLVRSEGEILVVDGELNLNVRSQVGVIGAGLPERQNLVRQVATYAEENLGQGVFDAIVVFTTFPDVANASDSRSELLFNEIQGIGLSTPDLDPNADDRREDFGLQPGSPLHRRLRTSCTWTRPTRSSV
ncbi:MAG: hypothetical protein HC923_09135 [Myxococcales bacterium]|nr:hypothetical protein [Myxococcales bacterium]